MLTLLLEHDIRENFSPVEFKKVIDVKNPNRYLNELQIRLCSRFYDSARNGDNPPVPNLGKPSLQKNLGAEAQVMQEQLVFALRNCDRDQFQKLRDGELSLTQVIARIYKEQTGVSLCVMDDLRGVISPEELAKEPNKYL